MPEPATAISPLSSGQAPNQFSLPSGQAPNQFGPHPSEPQDFGPPGDPADLLGSESTWRRNALLAAVAVVAVALVGGIAIILTRHPGGTAGDAVRSAPAGSQATSAGAAGAAGRGGDRGDRGAASQHRITTTMIFPRAHVEANGTEFGRVTAILNEKCTSAARGAFASALTSAGCQQVVRATFVDKAKRYAVTAGVAELPSPAAASSVDRSRRFGPDVWFTGLDGPARSGATKVSKSVGVGYNVVYGRYIVYSLATYSSGQNPTGHADAVRTLKELAKSFATMSRNPLITQGK
jgi:hypothetical protein